MADNYLERKMEDYRLGKCKPASTTLHRTHTNRTGYLTVKFPSLRVFVTGGASGIGRAIVDTFCKAGCKVAFCDNDNKAGRTTAQATGSQFHPVDVTDTAALELSMQRILDHWGDIDVIINNVGIGNFKPLEDTTPEEFDHVLSVNLRPVFITSRQLLLHRRTMSKQNEFGGRIINICSTRQAMSEPGTEAYSASKGAIYSLTHALMASLAPYRITVNSISPGWILTTETAVTDADRLQHPSQRIGTPADIARMCMFLASPDNDFINGENITIDGGMTRKMIYED